MAEKQSIFVSGHVEPVPWKISDVLFTYAFIFALSVFAIGVLLLTNIDTENAVFPALLQIVISASTMSVIYFIVTKKYKIPFNEAFGISYKDTPRYFIMGIIVSLVLVISTTLVSVALSGFSQGEKENPYVSMPAEKLRIISLLAVFIAPVVEEIFFRGFMQPALVKNLGMFGGILLTALIFGLSHSQYLGYSTALVAVTVIGLILGVVRQRTGSVMPGIFAHLMNNLFAALSLLF